MFVFLDCVQKSRYKDAQPKLLLWAALSIAFSIIAIAGSILATYFLTHKQVFWTVVAGGCGVVISAIFSSSAFYLIINKRDQRSDSNPSSSAFVIEDQLVNEAEKEKVHLSEIEEE